MADGSLLVADGEIDVPLGNPARVATPAPGDARLARLALNQRTAAHASVPEVVDVCAQAGVPAIGLWREPVAEFGLQRTAALVRESGLRVSSYCRGGFLTGADWEHVRADNLRAIDEAAELEAACLVMVVGGLPPGERDLRAVRSRVAERIGELVPHAASRGVKLALEPMHPMFCADRAVLSTLDEALDIAAPFPAAEVGVVVDTYHVWWDPRLFDSLARAGERIASFQVCDWIVPLPQDVLLGRGMMGDGHVDFRAIRAAVDAVGYAGDIEVEIFNADVWAAECRDIVRTVARRYVENVR
jgi:sugar phosphate isomerase/epimerase